MKNTNPNPEKPKKTKSNLFFPRIFELWDSFCLKGNPRNSSAQSFLTIEAAKSGKSLEQYIAYHDIQQVPIRVDVVSMGWMAMGLAYRHFSKVAPQYDEIVEFHEYFGERTMFGLFREYIIMATGLKYNNKK